MWVTSHQSHFQSDSNSHQLPADFKLGLGLGSLSTIHAEILTSLICASLVQVNIAALSSCAIVFATS